jgi:CrcB protein
MQARIASMLKLTLIAAGGAAGALLRYAVAGVVQPLAQSAFPAGTLAVNVAGCFAIGFLGALFAGPVLVREEYRAGILIGILGAFTTFSTFGWESFALANDGQIGAAATNLVLSNALGLTAVWIGYRLGESWFGV